MSDCSALLSPYCALVLLDRNISIRILVIALRHLLILHFVHAFTINCHNQWVIERDERVRNAQAAFDANQKEIARLQAFVDR